MRHLPSGAHHRGFLRESRFIVLTTSGAISINCGCYARAVHLSAMRFRCDYEKTPALSLARSSTANLLDTVDSGYCLSWWAFRNCLSAARLRLTRLPEPWGFCMLTGDDCMKSASQSFTPASTASKLSEFAIIAVCLSGVEFTCYGFQRTPFKCLWRMPENSSEGKQPSGNSTNARVDLLN